MHKHFFRQCFCMMCISYCFPSLCRCATEFSQKGPELSSNATVDNSPAVAVDTPADVSPAPGQPDSTSAPLEPQSSTIKSEVMPSSPVVIHHVQSSPVHIQQSQQSAALTSQPSPPATPSPTHISSPNLGKSQDREAPKAVDTDPPSPTRYKKTHGNSNGTASQDLVIEELQSSKEKNKSRAVSIKVCLATL